MSNTRYIEVDKKSLDLVVNNIKKLEKKLQDREVKKILRRQAKPMVSTMQAMIPIRTTGSYDVTYVDSKTGEKKRKTVTPDSLQKRYKYYRKGGARGRRPGVKDGQGRIVDATRRGNLRASIAVRTPRKKYRQSENEIWVGRRSGRKARHDGWYAHFLDKGSKYQRGLNFTRKTYQAHKESRRKGISKELFNYLDKEARKLRLKQ